MNIANKTVYFLIYACIIASAMAYGTVHQPTIALFYFVVAAMMVSWSVDCFLSGTLRYSRSIIQLPFYATAIYALIQVIPFGTIAETAGVTGIPRTISLAPNATWATGIHYFALAVFLSLSLIYIDSAARLKRLVMVLTIFGFVFAFFSILQSVLSPTRIFGIYERPSPFGSFVNRHNFAAYMEMAISIPLGLMFAGAIGRDKKLLYLTAIALMGTALLLSGSRGGFIALVAEIILLVILTTRTRGAKNIALKVGLSIVLVGAVIAGAVFVGGETSLTRFAETVTSKDITTNRTHIWSVTLKVIKANFPLGAGLGALGQAYTPFDDFNGLERVEQAHNDYLQVLADAGLVGAAIGAFFLFFLFRTARKGVSGSNQFRRGVAIGAVSGIFAILVHSVFDFVLHTTAISILFIVLITMLVASTREYPDDERDPDQYRKKRRSQAQVASFSRRSEDQTFDEGKGEERFVNNERNIHPTKPWPTYAIEITRSA